MALRVLLADESSTIKKVMQLALSDFAVEVKAVPIGIDVLSVTKNFKPDIIFADVLLTKKTGYEVCQDIKNDPETRNIPVVLMWSGFMEIDEGKAIECAADSRLEKPFDADTLRSVVTNLVQKAKANPVSSYLSFPEMPDFEETPSEETAKYTEPAYGKGEDIYSIPEVSEEEKFISIPEIDADADPLTLPDDDYPSAPIPSSKNIHSSKTAEEADEGGWAHQDLTKFKIQLPKEEPDDFAAKFVIPQDDDLTNAHIEETGDFEEISFAKPSSTPPKVSPPPKSLPIQDSFVSRVGKSVKEQMMQTLQRGPGKAVPNAEPNTQSKMDLNPDMVEKVVREEAREVIESICWKILPEVAERIVREELNKILKEAEKSI
ncbi:MAG: response regulator [Pseudobdellovibrionaceae bacterium]